MSARAIRALRGDNRLLTEVPGDEDDSDDEENDDDKTSPAKAAGRRGRGTKPSAFSAMLEGDSSEEEDSDGNDDSDSDGNTNDTTSENIRSVVDNNSQKKVEEKKDDEKSGKEIEAEEDIDAILNEFQLKDDDKKGPSAFPDDSAPSPLVSSSGVAVLLDGLDPRDLDMEYTMRNALLGTSNNEVPSTNAKSGRKKRQALLFGAPRDGWVRPPHFVGGGIGMTTYDQNPRTLPWPYDSPVPLNTAESKEQQELQQPVEKHDTISSCSIFPATLDPKRWFAFLHSENYKKDCADFHLIQQSGDLNALVLFVAHHPYVTDALVQLSSVLYQTNHSNEGLALLRRCLWIYESAALISFTRDFDGGGGATLLQGTFVDVDQLENANYFKALTKLIQVSNIASIPRTSFAVARYILSLDPMRDPMGMLLALDYFALASNLTAADRWLVRFVEEKPIRICYRDETDKRIIYDCGILGLPNWMYSYALALFRLNSENPSDEEEKKANQALKNAMNQFPDVIGLLLQHNDVDTTGRSFRRDWVTVLDFATERARKLYNAWSISSSVGVDAVDMAATLQVTELIVKIYIMQNARLWSSDNVLQWMYGNLKDLKDEAPTLDDPQPPSPALMRYAGSNPADYDNKMQQFPPDANIIDPNLIQHAMAVDPNRRRFIRRDQRGAGAGGEFQGEFGANLDNLANFPRQQFLGPPTNPINPDWPLLEVFWRSFLPWNRVEGIPPPRP